MIDLFINRVKRLFRAEKPTPTTSRFYVSLVPKNRDLTEEQFKTSSYIEVPFVVEFSLDRRTATARAVCLSWLSDENDFMRAACDVCNDNNYALKIKSPDGAVTYMRGIMMMTTRKGDSESFNEDWYEIALNQQVITVDP